MQVRSFSSGRDHIENIQTPSTFFSESNNSLSTEFQNSNPTTGANNVGTQASAQGPRGEEQTPSFPRVISELLPSKFSHVS